MFPVFHVHQLATVAAGDVGHHEVLNGLLFRVVVVVDAAGEANADAPVDLAVGAVDVIDDMVGNQDIAIVDGNVPLDRIALQMAKFAIGDAGAVHLVVETLAKDSVVGLTHADVINQQIAHHAGFLTADVDLRYRAKTAHGQPFNYAVGATYIESDILCPPLAFPYHFAAFLQNKAAAAIAG